MNNENAVAVFKTSPSRGLLNGRKHPVTKVEDLSVKQQLYAALIADPESYGNLTIQQVADKVGVHYNTILVYRKLEPVMNLALQIYRKRNHIRHAIDIHEAVAARAKQKGGAADARLYLEHQDKIMGVDPRGFSGNTFNVDKMILIVREENKKSNDRE